MQKHPQVGWRTFLVCVAIPVALGFLGSLVTRGAIEGWYRGLNKPPLNPPAWVFAPVWTALYVMMGIASFLVLRKGLSHPRVRPAMTFYAVQLILNAIWSPIFFNLQAPWIALGVIIAMWLAIVATMLLFRPISKAAFWLMLPYLLWVSFATYLNAGIAWLNR